MKRFRYILAAIAAFAVTSCYWDNVDIDTSAETSAKESTMDIEIRVAGQMIGSAVAPTAEEMQVNLYDLFIFKLSADGNFLEEAMTGEMPDFDEAVPGSLDRAIARLTVTVPSSGPKRIIAIANAMSAKVEYPDLTTIDNSMTDDLSDVTTYESFTEGLSFNFTKGKTPVAPFLMTGETLIANSSDASLNVLMDRRVARMDVVGGEGVSITKVNFLNAPRQCWPYVNNFTKKEPLFVDYPDCGNSAYFLFTPSTESKTADYRIGVNVRGTEAGASFEKTFYCPAPMYGGYHFTLTIKNEDGSLVASCFPDWSSGTFTVSGARLRNNKFTFPWRAEKNWGYELNWSTNLTGDVDVTKNGDESWYTAAVDGGLVRVCVVEDNMTGAQREASFVVSLGKYSHEITVVQQPMCGTVKFNGWEWMDSYLGGTLPLTEENILNTDTYGYYYQWGRNVAFPTFGTVTTADPSATRTSAQAEAMKEFILGDSNLSYEWMTLPPIPADRKSTWKERTGGTDPCPAGYHVPSYMEFQSIMPYTNAAGIGNFTNVTATIKNGEVFRGSEYQCLYVTSGYEEATIYAIKQYKTDGAYYLRLCRALSGGTPYLRIDTVKGDATSDFAGAENPEDLQASQILGSAKSFWASVDQSKVETLFFPANGRRARNTGEVSNQGLLFCAWAATTWDGSSSSAYFDAVGSNNRIYCMAQNRAHAHPIRCLKDYE